MPPKRAAFYCGLLKRFPEGHKIIFRGGVYVAENTSRGASVELSAFGGQPRRRAKRSPFVKEVQRASLTSSARCKTCVLQRAQSVKKASQSFASADVKKNLICFRSDLCANENTSRGVSVELSASGGQPRRRAKRSPFVKEVQRASLTSSEPRKTPRLRKTCAGITNSAPYGGSDHPVHPCRPPQSKRRSRRCGQRGHGSSPGEPARRAWSRRR